MSYVPQARAEAVLIGLVLGYIIPSLQMLFIRDPRITAFWQPFPLWQFLLEAAYLVLRPTSKHPKNGHLTIQVMYAIVFFGTSILHVIYVLPVSFDGERMKQLFIPGLVVPDPKTITLEKGVLDLIQWDFIFASLAALFGCLWASESFSQAGVTLAWFIGGSLTVGPGATMAGIFAWREAKINALVRVSEAGSKAE